MTERTRLAAPVLRGPREKTPKASSGRYSHRRVGPEHTILQLQRDIGNQAVLRMARAGVLQAKLRVGQPGDIFEQEADRVTEQVMRMPEPQVQRQEEGLEEKEDEDEEIQTKPISEQITPLIQRQEEELGETPEGEVPEEEEETESVEEPEEEEEELLLKPASGQVPHVGPGLQAQIRSLRGGGQPLSQSERNFFEPRFGYDFSGVRVHTDARASGLARALNSEAFTIGQNVVFGSGQYKPETTQGNKLLAHELTHVLQQGMSSRRVVYRMDQSNFIQRAPRWAGFAPAGPPVGKILRIDHTIQSLLSTTPMIQANRGTTYMWRVYNLAKKRGNDATDSEIKTTLEYQHYMKYWKHVGMTEPLALFACRRIIDRFLRGIRGRKANFLASGWDAIRVKTNIPHGVVNVKNYTSWGKLASKGGMHIELEWIPNKGGKYSAPGSVNWFQTVSTNQSTDMLNPPPPDLSPIKFVDGDSIQGKQEIQTPRFYYSAARNDYSDIPTRWSNRKGTVYFYAETSAVGIKGWKLERLATYSWGFKLYRSGRSGRQMRIKPVSPPSGYHLKKLAELQALQKAPNP